MEIQEKYYQILSNTQLLTNPRFLNIFLAIPKKILKAKLPSKRQRTEIKASNIYQYIRLPGLFYSILKKSIFFVLTIMLFIDKGANIYYLFKYFLYFLLMDLGALNEKLTEEAFFQYFKRVLPAYNCSKMVDQLKRGQDVSAIFEQQYQSLTVQEFSSLYSALQSTEFMRIFEQKEKRQILIHSQPFKILWRTFSPAKKNIYLLIFLIKLASTGINEADLREYYSNIDRSEQRICQQILKSKEYLIWAKMHGSQKIQRQEIEKTKQIDLIKLRLKQLLKFTKKDMQNLILLIINQLPEQNQLARLQDQMLASDHRKLIKAIKSEQLIHLKKKIHQINKSNNPKQLYILREIFKDFKFDSSELIDRIVRGEEYSDILDILEEQISAKQYKRLMKIIESHEVQQIKINLRMNKLSSQEQNQCLLQKKEEQQERRYLQEMFQSFKINTNALIDNIMEGKSLISLLDSLENELTIKKHKELINIIESEKIQQLINKKEKIRQKIIFKSNPNSFFRSQLTKTNQEYLQRIKIQDDEDQPDLYNAQNLREVQDYLKIKQSQARFHQGSVQFQKLQMEKSKKLKSLFKTFNYDMSNLIQNMLANKNVNKVLNSLQNKMNARDFSILKGLMIILNTQSDSKIQFKSVQKQFNRFFNQLLINTSKLQSAIFNGDLEKEKKQIEQLSKAMHQIKFKKFQSILYSCQLLKYRCEQLKNFDSISSSSFADDFYSKFSMIIQLITCKLKHYMLKNFNIYQLVIRLLKGQKASNILKDQENILQEDQLICLEQIINSQELFKILYNFNGEKNEDQITVEYYFRQLKVCEKLKQIILSGKSHDQFSQQINMLRITKPNLQKLITNVVQQQDLKILIKELRKKAKLNQIFHHQQDKLIIDKLSKINPKNLKESLQAIKQRVGIKEYEAKCKKIYSLDIQQITGVKLVQNQEIRQILNFLYQRDIFVDIQFIKDILSSNSIKKTLEQSQKKFTYQNFLKIKQQFKNREFLRLIYKNKCNNFEDVLCELKEMFSFLTFSDKLAESIIYESQFCQCLEEILNRQTLQCLEILYPTLRSNKIKQLLDKIQQNIPYFEQKFIVQKKKKRFLYKKNKAISDIKFDKTFDFQNDEIFVDKFYHILQDDFQLCEHIQCVKGIQYEITYLGCQYSVLLPSKQSIQVLKQHLKKLFSISNQICVQLVYNNQLITPEDKDLVKKYQSRKIYVAYQINLIVKIQQKQAEEIISVLSSQTIKKVQEKASKIINMKIQSQKWYMNGQQILNRNSTFESLQIRQPFVRIKIIEARSLEYYGFDKIVPIQRAQFKSFYIEDDEQTKQFIKYSQFPSYDWTEPFRKICLGYIFSCLKKHSRIQSCLKHLQNLIAESGKDQNLWQPKTLYQKCYFNETYVIHNIIKSSSAELRTDIFKCLMVNYPIPLITYEQSGEILQLFEENYWITNKAFTIVSFGLTDDKNGKKQQINGKSTLLNRVFETDFQDRANLHRQCSGGINIQYNIYRNDEYFVNLVDISRKIQEDLLLKIVKSSNMIIIHTITSQEAFVQQWIKEKNINIPVIIFIRDVQNIFQPEQKHLRKRQKQKNDMNSQLKKYSLVQISVDSLKFYNNRFNQIANSIQLFVRTVFSKMNKEELWRFSDFLAENSNQEYLQFNHTLKKMHKSQEDLSRITNYFYDWKIASYKKDVKNQKQNNKKMNQITEKAVNSDISQLLKQVLVFYHKNSSKAIEIMSKLRMFLTITRNELFRDFNQLYSILKAIHQNCKESDFKSKKSVVIHLLRNISQMKRNLTTPQLIKEIQQFMEIQKRYQKFTQIDQKWKKIFKNIIKQFEDEIQPKIFSIQNFWRELISMLKFNPHYSFKSNDQTIYLHENIVNLSKKQINQSQNFQIINGDLLQMPNQFLKKIFENHESKKVMIIAIFGPQSSGKSTLLNFVLGCDFMSSAGRCTKGVYGTYFQISNKQIPNCQAILVLDTEGLFSNYKNQKFQNRNEFDNKLVLFCLQVCDLIIMNTKGDMTIQCQQILANAFDSQALDPKNLPSIYFVLNCNGGPANVIQTKQIEKTCDQIIKLNPSAESVVSGNNSKGMPMAFNQISRKTNAIQISKFMTAKKQPSDLFYKQTISLSQEIFRILQNRGKVRGRTLSQAFDDMGVTWATINRFSILTQHANRKVRQLQQKIQKWIKIQSEYLQFLSLQSKKEINIMSSKKLRNWEKSELMKFKQIIQQLKSKFQIQFPKKMGDNVKAYNKFVEKSIDDLDSLFETILDDLKRAVMERKYRLQMEQSHQNGLDDILTLVKHIKTQQIIKGIELSIQEKEIKFQQLWKKRIVNMRQSLNRNKMAQQHFKNMSQMYNSVLKASSQSKSIYRIESNLRLIQNNEYEVRQFHSYLVSQIKGKYKQLPIFQSSNLQPVMNIQKKTGDLSFKYLDMSKYFEKRSEKAYVSLPFAEMGRFFSSQSVKKIIQQKTKDNAQIKLLTRLIYEDLIHLFGIKVKQKRIQQWANYVFRRKWYNSLWCTPPYNIKFPQDLQINQKSKFIKDKLKILAQLNSDEFSKQFKIFGKILDEVKAILLAEKSICIYGINEIITKILKILSEKVHLINEITEKMNDEKLRIQQQMTDSVCKDLQKLNLCMINSHAFIFNLQKRRRIQIIQKQQELMEFSSVTQVKQIIKSFSQIWNKEAISNYLTKGKVKNAGNSIFFGYINQYQINIKKEYASQKILQTYIGKQYQEFLNQIQKSNFKNFIRRELNYQICFLQIFDYIKEKQIHLCDLNFSITALKNKVNQILNLINKDLQQVSQKLRFDFIIDLHSYSFYLLWLETFKQQWKNRQNLIQEFNNKKQDQYIRFLELSSGKVDQQNKATSKTFIQEYIKFLNQKISQQKKLKAINLSDYYNHKYTREKIQEQVELRVQKQTNQDQLLEFILEPGKYIDKVLQEQVRANYLTEIQKYSVLVDYKLIVRQLAMIVTEIYTSGLPDIEECSIEDVFDISMVDQMKNIAFIRLFCQIILKRQKDYVSSEQTLGSFSLKQGMRFKLNKNCTFKQNSQFLNYIETKQIVITNLKMFCQFLKQGLQKIFDTNELKLQVTLQDKHEAIKNLKIQICKSKCPICKKSCDIDMFLSPHHTIHKCNFGHQIRAFGGMAIEDRVKGVPVYKASILRCDDLTPDSRFQYNGTIYKWSGFKLQYSNEWNFQVSSKEEINKSFYMKLWKKLANKICMHYNKETKQKKMQVVQYSDEEIKSQMASFQAMKPAHYIFFIDESSSMSGQKWNRAIQSLKDIIQTISNNNKDNNLIISLSKFNSKVTDVFNSVSPIRFNKNAVAFSGGYTNFSPVFKAAIRLIEEHLDKDNIVIFISDGEAEYPQAQIKRLIQLMQGQTNKGLKISYTSILIKHEADQKAPVMQKITYMLKGKHQFVLDALDISSLIKEIHFKS